jgi:hypothetical protein
MSSFAEQWRAAQRTGELRLFLFAEFAGNVSALDIDEITLRRDKKRPGAWTVTAKERFVGRSIKRRWTVFEEDGR